MEANGAPLPVNTQYSGVNTDRHRTIGTWCHLQAASYSSQRYSPAPRIFDDHLQPHEFLHCPVDGGADLVGERVERCPVAGHEADVHGNLRFADLSPHTGGMVGTANGVADGAQCA